MKRASYCAVLLFFVVFSVSALEPFKVSDIRVEGLQRISAGTIFNYLPIRIGDTIGDDDVQQGIRALFSTGFFRDVQLDRDGDDLVVRVIERPSIAQIDFVDNKEFKNDELLTAMEQLGLAPGRVFNQSLLERVEQDIQAQYLARGYYGVELRSTLTPLERNRVALTLTVSEGEIARIKEINIIGNDAFDDKTLLKRMEQRTERRIRFWSKRDRYSKQKLEADLEAIASFYQNRGYLDFAVESAQVSLSPDKSGVFVSIGVREGERYIVGDVRLSGETVVPPEEIESLVELAKGSIFSRQDVTETRSSVRNRLADEGYAFANVNAIPKIDEERKQVDFDFIVDPGRRVYVRRINISGNNTTRDEVIRRELRQVEGGWYSEGQIRRSRERLQRLGYFEDVRIATPAVAGTVDQVDLNITVVERPTGSFLFGVGYSDAEGVLLQGNINQRNLLGTGKELILSIDNSRVTDVYDIRFRNPYYTIDGISRGFNLTRRSVDSTKANTADYITETWDLGTDYRIPISEFNSLSVGFSYERVDLERTDETPPEFGVVIDEFPSNDNFKLDLSVARDTRNQFFFPDSGSLQRLLFEATVPGSDLEYYKINLRGAWYRAVSNRLTLKAAAEFGYGDGFGDIDQLPFYENFFAGGPNTVRGYESRSLGPQDSGESPKPIGGSSRILANLELLFPVPGIEKSDDKRLSLFVDGGQVFGPDQSESFSDLRFSAGLAFSWFSPIGPLSISYGKALNAETGDDEEQVQFTLGTTFR